MKAGLAKETIFVTAVCSSLFIRLPFIPKLASFKVVPAPVVRYSSVNVNPGPIFSNGSKPTSGV